VRQVRARVPQLHLPSVPFPPQLRQNITAFSREASQKQARIVVVTFPKMSLQFAWDPEEGQSESRKTRDSFEEAMTVFGVPLARSHSKRLVLISFTGPGEKIRLISARLATRQERKDYEENVGS
jgi:uncharacterized DUF497 family protein